MRELAGLAGVAPIVASRAVRELEALGAVEALRPGRDSRVRFLPQAAAGAFLAGLQVPDLRAQAGRAFATSLKAPAGTVTVLRWQQPGDDPADPRCPVRVAVVVRRNEAEAADAAGAALDAVRAAGLPPVAVSTHLAGALDPADPVAQAILRGAPALGP